MRNNLVLFLFVLLLLSVGGNYLQYRSALEQESYRDQDNDRWQRKTERILYHVYHRDSVIQVLIDKGVKDSARHGSEQSRLISQANALKSKIKKGPLIIQDTIILIQDSLIADLSHERDTIRIESKVKTDSLQASINDLTGLFQEQWRRANGLQGKYDKERKKRFSIGPHAGYGFKGPDFGVSIQYSLFRF